MKFLIIFAHFVSRMEHSFSERAGILNTVTYRSFTRQTYLNCFTTRRTLHPEGRRRSEEIPLARKRKSDRSQCSEFLRALEMNALPDFGNEQNNGLPPPHVSDVRDPGTAPSFLLAKVAAGRC